ncbi:MAG: sulfotransferase [Planctomycetota bacterium]
MPPAKSDQSSAGYHPYPFYSPRFWHGMRPAIWWRLLRQGEFQVDLSRLSLAVGVTLSCPFNSVMSGIQKLVFGRSIATAELHGAPVFIVGHWRSGTTLLHELMVRDERLSSPSTYQCFAPHHFLITEWFFRRFASWMLPGKRPMDNMDAGWDRPQEDEFALLNLGLPSPYRRIAFPRRGGVDMDYLSLDDLDAADRDRWLNSLDRFMKQVSLVTGRPLVIKSPTHTGRVGHLAKAFPDAKFIHITRDPRSLFPSTCRLWRGLDAVQSLQNVSVPQGKDESTRQQDPCQIEAYVIRCLKEMYGAFHAQRESIGDSRLIDIRYEDLIESPVETLRSIYNTLRLSDFDSVEPVIQQWADTEHKAYQTNTHQLSDESEAQLKDAWGDYFQRYGYQ